MTVDIIMPCYYASDILRPGFEKIAQQTIIKDITLIIINDCSPYTDCEYQDLIEEYKDRINIKYYKTEHNSGPGIVRQLGLQYATSDFIWFQDDDDEIYDETSIAQLLSLIGDNSIEEIASIGGQTEQFFDWKNEKTIHGPSAHHQGTLFNRKILINNNIHYEPELSFKEEDGTFASLFILKTTQYRHLKLLKPVYLKRWENTHTSLCDKIGKLESMIALIGSKAISLQYMYELQSYMDSFVNEAIIFIPNIVEQLIILLITDELKLTTTQYNQIYKYINIYNSVLDYYNIDVQTISLNQSIASFSTFFSNGGMYGEFMIESIYNFKNNSPKYLQLLKTYLVETKYDS